jgi:hypothetical protein
MNKTLKWILIGLAIALGAFIIALPIFYMARHAASLADLGRPMMPFRASTNMPIRVWPVIALPFMGLFGALRVLLSAAVFGFAVYGVVALVRPKPARSGDAALQTPPVIPAAPAEGRVCASCGKSLHSEGEYCPYCGAKQ